MSHHGNTPFDLSKLNIPSITEDDLRRAQPIQTQANMLAELSKQIKDGDISEDYAKEYPAGKMTENDEGIIAFRITNTEGKIVLDFGKSIHWIGMTSREARGLVSLLEKHINEVE